ncbi:hypothetical protein [Rubritalea tangerina]|uniref:Uncharacterized protein n=1 Tax=Rubritalea tangerina TaxID=430798 RepID=A0ABW4Z8A0_9BACT
MTHVQLSIKTYTPARYHQGVTAEDLDAFKKSVGGEVAYRSILLQIVFADKSKIVDPLRLTLTGAKCLYTFFRDKGKTPLWFLHLP